MPSHIHIARSRRSARAFSVNSGEDMAHLRPATTIYACANTACARFFRSAVRPPAEAVEGYSHQEGAKTPGASPDDSDGLSERPFVNGGRMHDDLEGWSENNASASEAVVKAERHTTGLTIEKLQDRTVKHVMDAQQRITSRTSVLRHDGECDDHGNPKRPTEEATEEKLSQK
jgi:hypothetical protein